MDIEIFTPDVSAYSLSSYHDFNSSQIIFLLSSNITYNDLCIPQGIQRLLVINEKKVTVKNNENNLDDTSVGMRAEHTVRCDEIMRNEMSENTNENSKNADKTLTSSLYFR